MKIPVPDPRDLATLLPRVLRIVDEVEQLLITARGVVERIEATRALADQAVTRLDATTTRADALVAVLEPSAVRLVPLLDRLGEVTSPADADKLARLLDSVPDLADRVRDDVLPVVGALVSVSPDLADLLASSRELNELLGGLPGMGRVKKKVEESQQDDVA